MVHFGLCGEQVRRAQQRLNLSIERVAFVLGSELQYDTETCDHRLRSQCFKMVAKGVGLVTFVAGRIDILWE